MRRRGRERREKPGADGHEDRAEDGGGAVVANSRGEDAVRDAGDDEGKDQRDDHDARADCAGGFDGLEPDWDVVGCIIRQSSRVNFEAGRISEYSPATIRVLPIQIENQKAAAMLRLRIMRGGRVALSFFHAWTTMKPIINTPKSTRRAMILASCQAYVEPPHSRPSRRHTIPGRKSRVLTGSSCFTCCKIVWFFLTAV